MDQNLVGLILQRSLQKKAWHARPRWPMAVLAGVDKPRPFKALEAIKNEMIDEFDIEDTQWDLQLGQIANL